MMKNNNDYKMIESTLKEQLFYQDDAVETLIKTLIQNDLLKSKSKVRALFTFIGPANCGKHYLCELLVPIDSKIQKLKTFYMEQYSGNFGIGAEQLGAVSLKNDIIDFIKQNPNSILVFEDIEKAELQVQLALYTLFTDYEDNNTTSEKEEVIDFSNIIAVITTTVLSSFLQRKDLQKLLKNDPFQTHTFLVEKLANEQIIAGDTREIAFDKKLLSLLNEHTIIVFNKLNIKALVQIGAKYLEQMSQNFMKQSGITIKYLEFDTFVSLLTLSLSPYLNARHIKQKLPKQMFNYIYDILKIEDNITQITYGISKKAQKFVNMALKDEQLLLTNISKQHKHITLEWDTTSHNNTAKCVIKNAFYTQEKLNVVSHEALNISDITFDNIAGHKKVKDELSEIIVLFKEPNRLKHFELTPPKGIFLYGPSGMGKKLLARAFAYEANMPYTVVNGSDLFDAKNIHKAYAQAYASAPAIVILEDIDIQGVLNGVVSTMSIEPIMEELDNLVQSFEAPIFTIMTVSNHANIPLELLQAKRIDIHIEVPKLDMEARRFFIQEILQKPHEEDIDIQRVVRYISGMGGNALKRIGQESALYAAKKGLKQLTEEILLEQINIIKYGSKLEHKQIRDIEISMAKTAYHEAGHAVLSYILLPKIKIEQVTVAPRSQTLGFVSYHNEEYIDATSKEDLFNDICVLLAGRIAKMEKFGDEGMETGAISDLEAATMQVYAAIALFGMDEELGYINISGLEEGYSKQLFQEKIETRILIWMDKAKEHTQNEVKKNWKAIDAVAQVLIKKEMIDGEELKNIIKKSRELL